MAMAAKDDLCEAFQAVSIHDKKLSPAKESANTVWNSVPDVLKPAVLCALQCALIESRAINNKNNSIRNNLVHQILEKAWDKPLPELLKFQIRPEGFPTSPCDFVVELGFERVSELLFLLLALVVGVSREQIYYSTQWWTDKTQKKFLQPLNDIFQSFGLDIQTMININVGNDFMDCKRLNRLRNSLAYDLPLGKRIQWQWKKTINAWMEEGKPFNDAMCEVEKSLNQKEKDLLKSAMETKGLEMDNQGQVLALYWTGLLKQRQYRPCKQVVANMQQLHKALPNLCRVPAAVDALSGSKWFGKMQFQELFGIPPTGAGEKVDILKVLIDSL